MKTLLTLFGKERSLLEAELNHATSPEQAVKLVQERIDRLERAYLGDLNVAQVRLASFFLDALRQSIAALTAAHSSQIAGTPAEGNVPQTAVPSSGSVLKVLQALTAVAIFGDLFSLSSARPGTWLAILLMAVLVGLEVALLLDKKEQPNLANAAPAVPQIGVRVDSKVLLDNLTDALATIDSAVARTKETDKPLSSGGLEELPELLNLIQRLWGASFLNKPQMALELAKLLPQVLREQGIRAEMYRQDSCDRTAFDFEPSIDPSAKESVTVTPALFKGDRLLLKGRVIEPATTSPQN